MVIAGVGGHESDEVIRPPSHEHPADEATLHHDADDGVQLRTWHGGASERIVQETLLMPVFGAVDAVEGEPAAG
jgi:tRNA A22 N-methylase